MVNFDQLVEDYSQKMYFVARRIVASHDDANDVVQNSFIKVWQSLDTFRGQSGLYTWIYRVVVNESLSFLRSKKSRFFGVQSFSPDELDRLIDNDSYFEPIEAERQLAKAILLLAPRQRAVFNMRYYDELPYAQIAEIMGVSEGSLKASYHIAAKKIEHQLNLSILNSSNE
ncbi:MAG: RNA polymerase sigma factor [Mucinivorans sp.]